jgi:hypothetical protein
MTRAPLLWHWDVTYSFSRHGDDEVTSYRPYQHSLGAGDARLQAGHPR